MRTRQVPLLLALVLVGLAAACSDDRAPAVPPPGPRTSTDSHEAPKPMPGEEYAFAIEREAPGFGGMYYDEEGDLVVYLKDLRLQGQARAAVHRHYPFQGKRGVPDAPPAQIRFRQGRFSFVELNRYWHRVNEVAFAVPGVVMTDVDDRLNRIEVVVRDGRTRRDLLEALARHPLPDGSVHVSECTPDMITCGEPSGGASEVPEALPPAPTLPEGDTTSMADGSVAPGDPPNNNPALSLSGPSYLTSYRASLEGGLQVTFRPRTSYTQSYCTLGFNVRYGNGGFVTASHCSPRMGSAPFATGMYSTDAYYYQPKLGQGVGNYLGWEYLDPEFRSPSYWFSRSVDRCTGNYYCRWSDALFVAYSSDLTRYRPIGYGLVARTRENTNEVSGAPFRLTGKAAARLTPGGTLYLVGSQSGLRRGTVEGVCQVGPSYWSNGRNNMMMCQDRVRFSTSTHGDSGAPVIAGSPTSSSAVLYGILSGGTATFGDHVSHIINIETDLGLGPLNVSY